MKTILVPTDFSENATNAIEYAAEYAATLGSQIFVLHVYTPQPTSYGVAALSKEIALAKEEVRKRVEAICKTIREEYTSVHCTSILKDGEVPKEIIQTAEDVKAELIIMGTQGASGFEKIIFGTNATAVIEKSTCPVLSVPQDAPFIVPQKVLFATNFSYSNVKSAVELIEFVKRFNAAIIIGHVKLPNEKFDPEKSIEKFSREISWLTDYSKISYKIFSEKTVQSGLDALIEETGSDMIALSTRRRTLFEKFYYPSITKKFASHSRIPLFAFHTSEDDFDNSTIDF